jgi:putative transposase
MKRAYKFKIKPTVKQQNYLLRLFGCTRFIYNWGLNLKIKAYKEQNKSLTYTELSKELTQLKKNKDYNWLCKFPIEPLQQSLRNLDAAYVKFFREHNGFPKFKSKKRSKDSAKHIRCVHFDFNKQKVKIPRCGWVKLCKNKTFELSKVKIGTLTISRDNIGEFWCSIVVEDFVEQKSKPKVSESTAIGIDLGIKDFAILSDGTKFENPKYYKKYRRKLKILHQRFSRTQKGSKRREIARKKLAKQYIKITNMQTDYLHKLSTYLVNHYDTICLENLNV